MSFRRKIKSCHNKYVAAVSLRSQQNNGVMILFYANITCSRITIPITKAIIMKIAQN